MTIAYDNTLLPKEPVRWHMRRLLLVSGFMGLMAVAQTVASSASMAMAVA